MNHFGEPPQANLLLGQWAEMRRAGNKLSAHDAFSQPANLTVSAGFWDPLDAIEGRARRRPARPSCADS